MVDPPRRPPRMLHRRDRQVEYERMAGINRRRRVAVVAGVVLAIAAAATVTAMAAPGRTHARTVLFAYVANSSDGTVTPINLATGRPGTPIKVGRYPLAIAITP